MNLIIYFIQKTKIRLGFRTLSNHCSSIKPIPEICQVPSAGISSPNLCSSPPIQQYSSQHIWISKHPKRQKQTPYSVLENLATISKDFPVRWELSTLFVFSHGVQNLGYRGEGFCTLKQTVCRVTILTRGRRVSATRHRTTFRSRSVTHLHCRGHYRLQHNPLHNHCHEDAEPSQRCEHLRRTYKCTENKKEREKGGR